MRMRKTGSALVAALAGLMVAGTAQAADMPVKAPPRAAAPAPFSWSGLYIGGHVGGAWGTVESELPFDHYAFPISSHTINGFLAGGQAGINWQVSSWLVLGVEGQLSWTDMKGSTPCVLVLKCTTEVNWLGSVAGRVGFAHDRTLFYVKGGVAFADSDYSASLGPFSASASDTRTGVMFGAGIEHAFMRNWSAKLEYNYMDFDTDTFNFTSKGGGCYESLAKVAYEGCYQSGSIKADVTQKIHLVKFGLNYRFDWGGPAVTARY